LKKKLNESFAKTSSLKQSIINKETVSSETLETLYGIFRDRKNKKTFCDGVLQSNGNRYSIHKCILGASSQFFEKLFTTEVRPINLGLQL